MTDQQARKSDADAAMLAAPPPAPSVGDVVQWNERNYFTLETGHPCWARVREWTAIGDRMAAALTAAYKENARLTISVLHEIGVAEDALQRSNDLAAEVERLRGEVDRALDPVEKQQAIATAAESSLETARRALEEMRADHLTVYTYLKPLIRKLQVSGTAENLSAGWELRTEAVAVIDLALLHAGNHITTEERKAVRESALTALPSPPIRKIKGEG